MKHKPSIVSVGAGNVSTHLIPALHKAGHPVLSVFSRTLQAAQELAALTDSDYTDTIGNLPMNADIYIISLSDDAIKTAVDSLKGIQSIVVHTAGSIGMDVFEGKINKYGVIYPFQTFTKSRKISFTGLPFFLEASDLQTMQVIKEMISSLSSNISETNSEERRIIHLAGVFACNFTNYMFTCANKILSDRNIPFNILEPLITETINKALSDSPGRVQTGPAVRKNQFVLDKHIAMLKNTHDLQKIYTFVSNAIMEHYNKSCHGDF